ncbi:MAG: glycosyltransferase family 39 protein [Flavobacteriales bacterium]|nr:glycosyltransferase family 39 protein [Flavobacteriales bacterium]MCX7768840.1 glycosyltransferase family 39 protein [Flavobacteriales bacterium]MDW8410510.1 glycosyltransferase family 39 protein [Flavobacteriales bacterium]
MSPCFLHRGLKENSLVFLLIGGVYAMALPAIPLEPDSAQYASISREMAETGEFIRVQHRGQDYLDKPPLLFWMGALWFKIFGASPLTWHLSTVPAMVALVAGLRRLYFLHGVPPHTLPIVLALCLGSPACLLMFYDVRCELWLTVFCVWAWVGINQFLAEGHLKFALLAGLTTGGALLSKGMVALLFLAPYGLYQLVLRPGSLKKMLRLLLIGIPVALLCVAPHLLGLWQAFGPWGWKFFFWVQSFGRITGENVWRNDPDPFFLWHTALWAFAPAVWAILGHLCAPQPDQNGPRKGPLIMALAVLLAFSLSRYQLPHYIFPVAPWIAWACGPSINSSSRLPARLALLAGLAIFSVVTLITLLFIEELSIPRRLLGLAWLLCLAFSVWIINKNATHRMWYLSVLFSAGAGGIAMGVFYPALRPFRAGVQVAFALRNKENAALVTYRWASHELDFLYNKAIPVFEHPDPLFNHIYNKIHKTGKIPYVALKKGDFTTLRKRFFNVAETRICFATPYFHTSQLNFNFLNPTTRKANVDSIIMVKLRFYGN